MSKPAKKEMSSFFPKAWRRAIGRSLENRLPPRMWNGLQEFWTQTRLIFSKTVLLILVAMFVMFTFQAFSEIHSESNAGDFLTLQTMVFAIIMSMSLWTLELESKTYEMLLMRIPNLHKLALIKLIPVFVWVLILSLPFFAAFGWFVSIPFSHLAVYLFFAATVAIFASLLTCVVSTFLRVTLATGIVAFIIMMMTIGFLSEFRLPFFDQNYNKPLLNPFSPQFEFTPFGKLMKIIIINRLLLLAGTAGLYAWLLRRLGKTEKWIG